MNKLFKLLLAIIICEGVGLIGSIFTFNSVNTWYITLNKPFFNPPAWIFGPVWTILYLLMGISLFIASGKKKTNLNWFWTQLIFNSIWSMVFFGLKNPLFAFIVIVVLWISIFKTIIDFRKIDKNAAYLLIPYLLWVSFATALNLSIVFLNK